jgi:hypothetical protein
MPPYLAGDLTVVLDGMAHAELADRSPLLIDQLASWEERSQTENRIDELLRAVREHPDVLRIEHAGYPLIDFVEYRLRPEIVRLLRGWMLAQAARAGGAGVLRLVCDPAAPAALLMGIRAAFGLDLQGIPYRLPSALPGSDLKRALARPLMQGLAAVSPSGRTRVAAVAAGKLSLALASLPAADLRAAGVGVMPFPGLDHGNSALLALRRRLPLLPTYGPRRAGCGPVVALPERLRLDDDGRLDHALAILLGRVLGAATRELAESVSAMATLRRASSLRSLLLPSGAYGASRLLIAWARKHGVRVGVFQHGIYIFQEFDGGDRRADVVFGWGAGTAEQMSEWPYPHPTIIPVGVPGTVAAARPSPGTLRSVLVATSDAADTPIAPTAFCELFIETIAAGLGRLSGAGVELQLRPHPNENPDRYRRLLRAHGIKAQIVTDGPFSAALAKHDLLISSASSVAFEAGALGMPVLLWLGGTPQEIRERHLVRPWVRRSPGMFERQEDFSQLIDDLLERPAVGFETAHGLGRQLARYAEPFDPGRFADGLRMLAE